MNLNFSDVNTVERDGKRYTVQRARLDGQDARFFWPLWRSRRTDALRKILSIRKEAGAWYVYRIFSDDPLTRSPAQWVAVPYILKNTAKMLDYQPRAVAGLCRSVLNHNAGLDASETGLGKTYTAYAVCRELVLRPGIICKKTGISNWVNAGKHFGISPAFIINWEMARTGKIPFFPRKSDEYSKKYVFTPKIPPGILLIFDEVHSASHNDTINSSLWMSCRGITSLSLSATIADRPARCENLFHFLGIAEPANYRTWLRSRGAFRAYSDDLESLAIMDDMKAIHKNLFPEYGVRLNYDDPDVKKYFPDVSLICELINLAPKSTTMQNELYKKTYEKIITYRNQGKNAEVLVAELRYRQAAELLKVMEMTDMIRDSLAENLSVAVFVNFRESLFFLVNEFKKCSYILGEQDDRETHISSFQSNKTRLIICMGQAGGQSINLHDIHGGHRRLSLICPTYDPIVLHQIIGRTRRAGSKTVPIIKLIYAARTVEEKVAQRVNKKLSAISALNRGDLGYEDYFNI